MADITRYPFRTHLRSAPTMHVEHVRNGVTVHAGAGASFWFRPLSSSLSEAPIADQELPLFFHAMTQDFQDVTVQATITFRFSAPDLAVARIDFSIDPTTGLWRAAPLQHVAGLLTEIVQQHALGLLAELTLTEALRRGVEAVRARVEAEVADDRRLAETGISVIGVRVVAIRPEPEMEKALRTPAREQVQQEADRATYERRAVAVERERTISENELQNQIELARREEQLVSQQGANARRRAEENAAADGVAAEAEARRAATLAAVRADSTRLQGAAEADAETARAGALSDLPDVVVWAMVAREVAPHLPAIQSLVVTPDLVSSLLSGLQGAGDRS